MAEPLRFPQGFLWGTATGAHHVEGQNSNNQWWDWEQQPGKIWNGDRSGDACGWWRSAEGDMDRMVALANNAHRMSIEWSRIEPEEGLFDEGAINRYRELLEGLLRRGITPMVTLHHFTNPRWLEARGGWLHRDTPERFGRFAERAVVALGDLCTIWCTINEPVIYATQSYLRGVWPPGSTNVVDAFRVGAALLRGHAAAVAAVRKAGAQHRVGLVHQVRIFDPATPANADVSVAATWDFLMNGAVLQALETGRLPPPYGIGEQVSGLRGSCDFFGLNYYTRERVAFDASAPGLLFGRRFTPPDVPQGDATVDGHTYGELYADGLYRTLQRVARLGVPIYLTEFGLPDAQDTRRPQFLLDHLAAAHRAIQAGVDLRGVFYWSLLDNFEWIEGWQLKFGLYTFDPRTGERRPRASAGLYAAIARANAIPAQPAVPAEGKR